MEWTKEQKQAIVDNGANILVSAAAGSGKTTVLISRIIHKITEENVDIDKLLVVTFTNAAASEMKERLLNKLYEKIDEDPMNVNLQKQINLISHAHISTIHSFCLDVIRNNFFEIGVSANFRVGDETEIEIMKEEAIEKVFEDNYENGNEDFQTLLKMYTTYKDDQPLKDLILKLYDFISSVPNPEKWLDDAINDYDVKDTNFADTKWGKIIIEYTQNEIKGYVKNLEQAKRSLDGIPNLVDFYINLQNEINFMNSIDYSNWNKIYTQINSKEKNDWPRKSKLTEEEKELKENAKKVRDDVKKDFEKKIQKLYVYSSEEAIQDIKDMQRVLKMIQKLLNEFITEFQARKKDKNVVDFSDIEHLALKILVNEDGSKTDVAKKYDFNEIMCDEYQDSNLLQEQILKSVSNGHNIFMVGDVKQSIYRFREARPDLFLDKYEKYKLDMIENHEANNLEESEQGAENKEVSLNNKENNKLTEDSKILLYKNFRSRKNVVDFVNIIFQDIMSKELGEIDYNENEYLNFAANFEEPKINVDTEIYVIETNDKDEEETPKQDEKIKTTEQIVNENENEETEALDKATLEARLIAKKIMELVHEGVRYKDIAILLRSPSVTAPIYEKELIEQNIPIFTDTSNDYLSSIEIDTILSLLKIIDNPLQDIPLVTVMRSVIGGFTDNDLINIRLHKRNGLFYYAVKEVANEKEETSLKWKAQNFLDMVDGFRKNEKVLPLDELIWKIYSDTGYYNYVRLMPNGKQRQANLRKLFEKAKEYEKISFKGIFNFIIFIEKVANKNSSSFSEAKVIGENDDVVRIMSIHKSKGLEFPVCFIGGVSKKFNLKDMQDKIIYDQEIGIGVNFIDKNAIIEFPALTKTAINLRMRKEAISEEMRVLYVALTRAKEKLIIVGADRDALKNMQKIQSQIKSFYPAEKDEKIDSSLVGKYTRYLDWIELVLGYSHPENVYFKIIEKDELKPSENDVEEKTKTLADMDLNEYDKEKYKKVDKILSWKPDIVDDDIPNKTSVTALKNDNLKFDDNGNIVIGEAEDSANSENDKSKNQNFNKANSEIEQFVGYEEKELQPNEKGTLIHLALQKLNDENIDEMIEKLNVTEKERKFLIENKSVLENYISSELFKELKVAKEVHKEEAFYMNVKYNGANVLVQGVIDLYYINKNDELILVDYKTDRNVNDDILNERYKNQLLLYKAALEKSLKRKVSKTMIYSTFLNKLIVIN